MGLTPLKPLNLRSPLAPSPTGRPLFSTTIKNSHGQEIVLGDPKATRGLVALMDAYSVNGGAASHWGGPAAMAEMMSALHGILFAPSSSPLPWFERFNFVNDAGHTENGIYALRANLGYGDLQPQDLWKFRSLQSPLTGHGESHVYPQGVLLSNGPLASALPQAQGLAVADKIIGKDRVTFCVISDGACMEGEAREVMASLPGLATKGKVNPFLLLLSDNNTKLSGRIDQDSFDMQPTFNVMEGLGWKVFHCPEGHHLQTVYQTLEAALAAAVQNPLQPVFVHLKTIKGYGVHSTEVSASGGHGFPLKKNDPQITSFIEEVFQGNAPSQFREWTNQLTSSYSNSNSNSSSSKSSSSVQAPSNSPSPFTISAVTEKIQVGIARAAEKVTLQGYPLFSLSSDLQGSTGIAAFQKRFPDRYIDVGVAEANMVSMAVGLAKHGLIPIVDTFAQFGVTKGNLPLTMAALSESPLIALFSHTGFQDAADGASHQATTYFAATCSIPKTVVVCLSCSQEAEVYMEQATQKIKSEREKGESSESVIFFLGREDFPSFYQEKQNYSWGKAQVLTEHNDPNLLIVSTGPLVKKLIETWPLLLQAGIRPIIVNNPFINRPDLTTFIPLLQKVKGRLLTLEDHQQMGGMGQILTAALLNAGQTFKAKTLGIKGHFGRSAYLADQLYENFHLGSRDIVSAAKELCEMKMNKPE